jgi:tetrahydromethanopterin:alpha-L-glutamate ligase
VRSLPARALRVAIMTDAIGWHTRALQRALRERGAEGRCVDLAQCRIDTQHSWHGLVLPGFGAELPNAVLVRGIAAGSFEQVTKRLGVLHALREFGVPVYNDARAIERSVDNALVLKPLFGSQGKHLSLVGLVNGRHVPLPTLSRRYGLLAYLQRFVPPRGALGFDWRVLVVGGRAVAAMRRVSRHWVHNVARGARCEPQRLDDPSGRTLAATAEAAARALEMDYAGVDLLPAADGIVVIEVNGVAAWQGLQRVTPRRDIARALVDDLLDRKLPSSAAAQRA